MTLNIDTTGDDILISLANGEEVIDTASRSAAGAFSEHLVPMIDEILKENKLLPKDLTDIVVKRGPGSWNGTRVGVVTAKILAFALKIPLKGMPEFEGEELAMTPVYPDKHEDTLEINYDTV